MQRKTVRHGAPARCCTGSARCVFEAFFSPFYRQKAHPTARRMSLYVLWWNMSSVYHMRVFCGIRRIRARGYSVDTRKGSCNGMRKGMQKNTCDGSWVRATARANVCGGVQGYDMCR